MHDQGGDELDDEQVRPDVDLVDCGVGLDVLDRAGLDDGEQALGVTARARRPAGGAGGGDRARPARPRRPARCRRRRRGLVAAAAGLRPWRAFDALEQVGGDAALGLAGGAAAAGAAAGGGRGGRRRAAAALAAAFLRASSARLRRCSGISVMRVSSRPTADRRCRRPCGPARSGRP